jgi:transposase
VGFAPGIVDPKWCIRQVRCRIEYLLQGVLKVLRLRKISDEERTELERLVRSRTEAVRRVERARIIWQANQGRRVPAIAADLGVSERTVRLWVKRFNVRGLDGLMDEPRAGHPPTYPPDQVGEVLVAALSKPTDLGLPFASWTLDRLEVYLNEQKSIPIKRSRIDELLIDEGLRWRTQEGWFGERAAREKKEETSATEDKPIDPEFAQKRGRLRPSIPARRQTA